MTHDTKLQVIQETNQQSLAGKMPFPQVVAKLSAIGVESYRVDLLRKEKIVYMPNGETFGDALPIERIPIAAKLSFKEIQLALKRIQAGDTTYIEFLKEIMQAGTTSYSVYLTGKKVIYFGRNGDMHVEGFPNQQ